MFTQQSGRVFSNQATLVKASFSCSKEAELGLSSISNCADIEQIRISVLQGKMYTEGIKRGPLA